ncbi:MAG TPA: hypothetical protein VMF11_03295 [Candidatus Baltobacteraceae bacterium]|nr:hypothetical protein [Candidatus Baltobacteraceae bacterium]
MTKTRLFFRSAAIAACVGIGSSLATPVVAAANTASTAAAIAIAAIVGTLIYDSTQHQYYYVNGGHRHYVNNATAQAWYQHQDPKWYRAHQSDFQRNPAKFDRDFRSSHHPPHHP